MHSFVSIESRVAVPGCKRCQTQKGKRLFYLTSLALSDEIGNRSTSQSLNDSEVVRFGKYLFGVIECSPGKVDS